MARRTSKHAGTRGHRHLAVDCASAGGPELCAFRGPPSTLWLPASPTPCHRPYPLHCKAEQNGYPDARACAPARDHGSAEGVCKVGRAWTALWEWHKVTLCDLLEPATPREVKNIVNEASNANTRTVWVTSIFDSCGES